MKKLLFALTVLSFAFATSMLSAGEEKAPAADAKAKVKTESDEAAKAAKPAKKANTDISLADLKKAMADKAVVLIDCNGSESFAKGHIPGALNFEAIKTDLAKYLPEDKAALIVAYCGGLQCGAYKAGVKAAKLLGYKQVKHFSGGLAGWEDAGEKLATPKHRSFRTRGASLCRRDVCIERPAKTFRGPLSFAPLPPALPRAGLEISQVAVNVADGVAQLGGGQATAESQGGATAGRLAKHRGAGHPEWHGEKIALMQRPPAADCRSRGPTRASRESHRDADRSRARQCRGSRRGFGRARQSQMADADAGGGRRPP